MSGGDKKAIFVLTLFRALIDSQSTLKKDEAGLMVLLDNAMGIYMKYRTKKLSYGSLDFLEIKLRETIGNMKNYDMNSNVFDLFVYASEYFLKFLIDPDKIIIWEGIGNIGSEMGSDDLDESEQWFLESIKSLEGV